MLREKIRTVPHFPKKGVMFRDVTTLLKDPLGFKLCVEDMHNAFRNERIDAVVGIESRGFIIGGALAHLLGVGFVPVRKEGKLPAEKECQEYELEYGKGALEMHKDGIAENQRVLIVDDLIATGGTALAAARLVEKRGGKVVCFSFIVDLPDLGGSAKLAKAGYNVYAQVQFRGK